MNTESGARRRISESGRIPWVRLESVIRCIAQTVRSSGENFINDVGTLPLGFELVLLLGEA